MGAFFLVQTSRIAPRRAFQAESQRFTVLLPTPDLPRPSKARLEYLDAIRGLAALCVVLNHYVYSFGNPAKLARYFPLGIWWDGMAGVSMFFVLSGFVLSLRYFDRTASTGARELNYARFFVARVFRIWIPYLAAVAVCLAIYHFRAWQLPTKLGAGSWLTSQWGQPLHMATVLRDAVLLRIEIHPMLINPSWTLSIELVISLLLPAALLLAQRSSGWLIFASLLLFQTFHVNVFILHFTAGILLAKHAAALTKNHRPCLLALTLLVALPLYNIRFIKVDPAWRTDAAWIISGLGALGILWVAISSAKVQRVLSNALLGHLGRVSYGLYLLHAPVLICITPRILHLCTKLGWYSNWVIGLAATLAISLLAAEAFYRWIEVPSIAAGKYFARMTSRLPQSMTNGLVPSRAALN